MYREQQPMFDVCTLVGTVYSSTGVVSFSRACLSLYCLLKCSKLRKPEGGVLSLLLFFPGRIKAKVMLRHTCRQELLHHT